MKPIFSRGPSLQIRLILAVLVALGIIIADSRLGTFSQIRTYMDTAVSPFYFISNGPRELLDGVSQTLASRDQLELENRALRQELLLKNSELLMLGQYKQENARLRELLGSPLRQDEQKMVTQVISTVNDPYSDQVVIDKGSVNGVYEGQPVISDKGVVGQVVAVAKLTSRVLLICDATHALPIQVLRNDIRVIAAGNGCTDDLQLEHLPANTDIRVGDVIYLTGTLVTCRDVCHRRLIELKRPIPYDLNGKAIFHAGPIVRKNGEKWEMVSVGPTTSMRMEAFEKDFIEQTGVKLVVGKGGMGPLTEAGCKQFKALHVIFPAGCAVVAATQVEEIEEVHWTELGMPESLWVCRVKEFGPLIVSIDTHGNNLIAENKKLFAERRDPIVDEICEHVHYIK